MIVLDNFTKYDILYRNYIKQFSKAYIVGSNINVHIFKILLIYIKTYLLIYT